MSWGERSCINFGNCDLNPTILDCNVDCDKYKHDEITDKDSVLEIDSLNRQNASYRCE